jgi:hypothetical protein
MDSSQDGTLGLEFLKRVGIRHPGSQILTTMADLMFTPGQYATDLGIRYRILYSLAWVSPKTSGLIWLHPDPCPAVRSKRLRRKCHSLCERLLAPAKKKDILDWDKAAQTRRDSVMHIQEKMAHQPKPHAECLFDMNILDQPLNITLGQLLNSVPVYKNQLLRQLPIAPAQATPPKHPALPFHAANRCNLRIQMV